jgi:hypothetical protein
MNTDWVRGRRGGLTTGRPDDAPVTRDQMTPEFRASFPAFAQGMSKGKERLDDVLKEVYRVDREVFLNQSGDWVAATYGQDQ